ncbi:hypothetical protein BJP44_04335 [Candidatus Williamhamiltonella defendens]|uniref:Phage protein n=1 Tax=Hamiltonella defensa subsp. Acyrthosiphon pisum (strain 5AT) TaxID=572265 RepID=C4K505_HAMD5|nr:BrnA antitoxin family protein [Candidatus Hamiltonella defensa]ACQ67648.1 hypothetical protein HDEF_0944 [Candidatus Hamiltonella defensa 5AT (Acyrthosiphon pisum)]ATW22349.1 hypothetical protein BJP44_04335 [Candidatus Hamiltonella defensa]
MKNHLPLIDKEGEVRELKEEDFVLMRPAEEVLPLSLLKTLGIRGPQKAPTKQKITIRLSQEVVDAFRATGKHWQSRMDCAMKNWLKEHSPHDVKP